MTTKLTTLLMNNTFNEKDLKFSNWVAASKIGELVKNPRMAIGHKSWKHAISPIARDGKWRQNDEYLYLQVMNATTIGIYHSYEYNVVKGNPKLRVPENMNGYTLVVPLINDRDRTTPNESDEVYNAFERLHSEVVRHICENREGLPKFAQKYTNAELAQCINSPFSREKTDKTGKKRSPTINIPFKYYKADVKKNKQENLITNCNKPGGKFHPKEFVSTPGEKCIPGKVDFVIRLCHLGFSTKIDDHGDTKLSINYSLELQGVNFKPMMKNSEPDLLGSMMDDEGDANEDLYGSKPPVMKDVTEFDDEPPRDLSRKGDDDEPSRRKKDDDEPSRRKKDDDEPSRRKKDDDEPSRRKKDDDEPSRRKKDDDEPSRRSKEELEEPRKKRK